MNLSFNNDLIKEILMSKLLAYQKIIIER
jgi:hypothetical protein